MISHTLFRSSLSVVLLASLAACTGMRAPGPATFPQEAVTSHPSAVPQQVPQQQPQVQPQPGPQPPSVEAPITEVTPPVPEVPAPPPAASHNPAVVALLDSAHTDAGAGRLPTASASLERALRIEPRNANLWHELAKVELQKGDYRKAENLAVRSNSWAAGNKALLAKNWHLIAEARSLRGDNAASKAALERAKAFE